MARSRQHLTAAAEAGGALLQARIDPRARTGGPGIVGPGFSPFVWINDWRSRGGLCPWSLQARGNGLRGLIVVLVGDVDGKRHQRKGDPSAHWRYERNRPVHQLAERRE